MLHCILSGYIVMAIHKAKKGIFSGIHNTFSLHSSNIQPHLSPLQLSLLYVKYVLSLGDLQSYQVES